MNEAAERLLTAVFTTTLFLSLGAVAFALLLRLFRVVSPGVQRRAWATVVLLGWVFVPVSIPIAWYEPEAAQTGIHDELPPVGYKPLDVLAPLGSAVPQMMDGAATDVADIPATEPLPRDPHKDAVDPEPLGHLPVVLSAVWLAGILVVASLWVFEYWRFARLVPPPSADAPPFWRKQWFDLLAKAGVRRAIPLRITWEIGPALCRLPSGYYLCVPRGLWQELSAEQRTTILIHELAHYWRGDVWKALALRVLALPHWFNPLVWLAVRRFEECGEWACDETVRREEPSHITDYAAALLKLGEAAQSAPRLSTAARGRGLALRVRRLLAHPMEDSKMKKLAVACVALGLVLICAVRFELVAQEGGDPPQDATTQETPNAAGVEHAEAMVEAAKSAYESILIEYELGSTLMENVYVWSRRWLDAELALIDQQWHGNKQRIRASRLEAFEKHLSRMQDLHEKVAVLYRANAIGGEPARFFGTKFFVAEAQLWAEGSKSRAPGTERPNREAEESNPNRPAAAPNERTNERGGASPPTESDTSQLVSRPQDLYANVNTLADALAVLRIPLADLQLDSFHNLATESAVKSAIASHLPRIERDHAIRINRARTQEEREAQTRAAEWFRESVRPRFEQIATTGEWPKGAYFAFRFQGMDLQINLHAGTQSQETSDDPNAVGLVDAGYVIPILPGDESERRDMDLDLVVLEITPTPMAVQPPSLGRHQRHP